MQATRPLRRILVDVTVVALGLVCGAAAYSYVSGDATEGDRLLPLVDEATTTPYQRTGPYPWPVRTNISPPNVVIGDDGVPVVKYPGVGYQPNPVTVAQWGLWSLRDGGRARAVRAADWLLEHMPADGPFLYRFPFETAGVVMEPPWGSALAQGQTISLLTRVYRLTGERRYLDGARTAFAPIVTPVAAGGLRRCFHGDCLMPWYEEYPNDRPTYVLNGFMSTLIGLYDLAPHDQRAADAYAAGRRTLLRALPLFTIRGRSVYALSYEWNGRRDYLPAGYLAGETILLRTLSSIGPSPVLERAADVREQQLRAL